MLPTWGVITRASIKEYSEAVRQRYRRIHKKEKGRLLAEFIQVMGYNRKAAIRLLSRSGVQRPKKRRGRTRSYGNETVEALRVIWEASDRLYSKRLQPFVCEMVGVMRQHEVLKVSAHLEADTG